MAKKWTEYFTFGDLMIWIVFFLIGITIGIGLNLNFVVGSIQEQCNDFIHENYIMPNNNFTSTDPYYLLENGYYTPEEQQKRAYERTFK